MYNTSPIRSNSEGFSSIYFALSMGHEDNSKINVP